MDSTAQLLSLSLYLCTTDTSWMYQNHWQYCTVILSAFTSVHNWYFMDIQPPSTVLHSYFLCLYTSAQLILRGYIKPIDSTAQLFCLPLYLCTTDTSGYIVQTPSTVLRSYFLCLYTCAQLILHGYTKPIDSTAQLFCLPLYLCTTDTSWIYCTNPIDSTTQLFSLSLHLCAIDTSWLYQTHWQYCTVILSAFIFVHNWYFMDIPNPLTVLRSYSLCLYICAQLIFSPTVLTFSEVFDTWNSSVLSLLPLLWQFLPV
jgi:hypothetical protein